MKHLVALAGLLTLASALPAIAQPYGEPPRDYYAVPPNEWQQRQFWRQMDEHRRQEYVEEWRHQHWRCDHGDRGACGWLAAHG